MRRPSSTVTLLFTDIEGSTKLLQRAGDRYPELVQQHRNLLRDAFERHGGREVDTEGDSFFVAFDRPIQAVTAAAQAQQALAAHAWPEDAEIRVRMGIHTGAPRLIEGDYFGLDVHKAARVMAAGHGGQVLLSHATIENLGDAVVVLDLGEHRLKDLLQPEHLYQLQLEGLSQEFPPLKTLGNRPMNLPVQPNALIGRERELEEVMRLLREDGVHLVTLTGTGGTGKTRLALQAAAELLDDFRSGVFFVSLAPVRDAALVVPAIAQTLAVREVPGEQLLDTLAAYLEEKEMLLLLDNFEQVVEAAPVVSGILGRAPNLKLLVTSRERLRLAGERIYVVPPLELPAATEEVETLRLNNSVALFVARAQTAQPEFRLVPESAAAVAEICRRLDGLPLALELAAARIAVLTPQALLTQLNARLKVLTHGPRDADERQQTLRRTIEWSYDLLTDSERRLFARLSVFVDGCRYDALETVCDAEGDLGIELLDGVQSLVDKSLVRQKEVPAGEPRFWMLETIREHAAERLEETHEADEVRGRHAQHVLLIAERAAAKRRGREADWANQLEEEQDNIRAALAWLRDSEEDEALLRLAAAAGLFWEIHGHYREGRQWLEEALARPSREPTYGRGNALRQAGHIVWRQGDLARARTLYEEMLAVARALNDTQATAQSHWNLGVVAYSAGDYERARSFMEQAADRFAELDARIDRAGVVSDLAFMATEQGEYGRARKLAEESLVAMQELGDAHGVGSCLCLLGYIAFFEARYREALSFLHEGLSIERELGAEEAGVAGTVTAIAACLLRLGRPGSGLQLAEAIKAFFEQAGAIQELFLREIRERTREEACAQMDHHALGEAQAVGRAMTLDSAVSFALEEAARAKADEVARTNSAPR